MQRKHTQKKVEMAHKNERAQRKPLLCITVIVLVTAVCFGIYLQLKSQLTTMRKQQDELVQQKIQLENDNAQLKSTNKQLYDDNKQLKTTNKQLYDDNKQLKATNRQLDNDNKQLKKTNKQLDGDIKWLKSTNKQLDDDNKQLKMKNKLLVDNTEQLKSSIASNISYEHVAPVILKMNNFTEKMKNKQQWYSDPFFAFWRGYKMCLKVYTGGFGDHEDTHVSVFLYLMKGPYDNRLEQSDHWPLRGLFKVELLDQINDGKYTHFILFDDPKNCTASVIKGDKHMLPCGVGPAISHEIILHSNYLKHDSLYFMISYQSFIESQQNDERVAPVILKMNNFTEKMKNKQQWYSDPFFAFWRGYKMCLKVYTGGLGDHEGTHVSVFLYLMKGPYDNRLEQSDHWPLRGLFKVELLDQINDGKYTHFILFDDPKNCTASVIKGDKHMLPCGVGPAISHEIILHSNYLKHDSLYFMISYQSFIESQQNDERVAPVILKMNNFTEKMKNKQQWYSDPFFAFWRGYKMCLKVYTGGLGDHEGTHVSVFLYLMKGPYDNRLEQSDHWPLRGLFKVELLDQINDGKYTHFILFDDPKNCTASVIKGDKHMLPCGVGPAISHEIILHSNYLKHDSLYFMISYQSFIESQQNDERVAPVILKMNNFTEKMKNKQQWYSDPFFAFWKGYKMCLNVYTGGLGDHEGTHISIFLYLMKGPYDGRLEQSGPWPLRGVFKVELLDQINDGKYTRFILFDDPRNCTGRLIKGDKNMDSCVVGPDISHEIILHSNYLKHDSLYFMISYQSFSESQQNDEHVAPVVFKMNNFTEKMKNKEEWYSDPFFAFWKGYKMCLNVYTGGLGDHKGTHISIFLYLMKGPYDGRLEQSGPWPLRGVFKVELLDQINDGKYTRFILFDDPRNCTGRLIKGDKNMDSCVVGPAISHEIILHSNYLKHDSLYFMISYQSFSESQQNDERVAPVIFKMNNFTEKMKNKEEWYSDPFFAFWRGYKMCLKVYAGGHGDAKGTHVSVYLYLMKGQYDDRLEQSGHWPLRGLFKVELLDQINYGNYTHYITFDSDDYIGRAIKIDMVLCGWALDISHENIHHGNYLKHDSLYFMISYQPNGTSKT